MTILFEQLNFSWNTASDIKFLTFAIRSNGTATSVAGMKQFWHALKLFDDALIFLLPNFVFIENVTVTLKLNVTVEHRDDGKDYLTVNDISASTDALSFSINMQYPNVPSVLSNLKNQAINSSWRLFKPIIDPYIDQFGKILFQSTFSPMLERLAIQDFVAMWTKWKKKKIRRNKIWWIWVFNISKSEFT